MMNKSRGESAYLIFLFGSSQFSGNSARAKPKNEYDSVFACCCCWFDEFCVFVAFVLRVRVRVRVLLLLVLQLLLQPTLGAVVRAGRSSILKNKFVVVVVVVLIVVVEKIRLSSFLCVKKKRERETLKAPDETDEQQAVKKKFGIKRETRSLHNETKKKSGNLGRRKTTHKHTRTPSSIVYTFLLSLFAGRKNTEYVHHQVSPNGGEEWPVRARGIEMERPRRVCSHANEKNEREETTEIRERERLGVERSGGE